MITRGRPQPYNKLKANLGHMRPCLKKKTPSEKENGAIFSVSAAHQDQQHSLLRIPQSFQVTSGPLQFPDTMRFNTQGVDNGKHFKSYKAKQGFDKQHLNV